MNLTLASVSDLLRVTLTDPAEAVRRLVGLGLPMQARLIAFALVVVLSVLLTQILILVMPMGAGAPWGGLMHNPLGAAAVQAGTVLMFTTGISVVGGWFGGRARFDDALLLMVWLEFVLFVFQLVQVVLSLILPPVALIFGFLSVIVFFWLLVSFTAVLNGFGNRVKVLAGVLATFFAAAFLFALLATLLGFGPAEFGNV